MTDEEHAKLVEVGDHFWLSFGGLVAHHVARMPRHLEAITVIYLQDKCSIHNAAYRSDLEKERITWQTQ